MIVSVVLVWTSFPGPEDLKSVCILVNSMRSICSGQIFPTLTQRFMEW